MKEVEVLSELLDKSVAKSVEDLKLVAVLFSGGLDSSIIAYLAKRYTEVVLYTCGLKDSHDLKKARIASKLMGMPLREIELEEKDVMDAIPEVENILGTKDPATVTIALPLYLTTKEADESIVLSGQGADELFGGYARYAKMKGEELKQSLVSDIEKLICDDILGNIKIASHFSKEIRFPYLQREILNFALYLPVRHKVRGDDRKIILRAAAESMGLPPDISAALKKAAQFGSGIAPLINKIAKKKEQTLKEFFEKGGKC